jgi:dTDP-4-dehydrorhamnose reductase
LAEGCFLIAERSAEGIYHMSGEELLTPYDIAILTARHFSLDESLITKTNSDEFKQTAVRPLKTGFIIDKAKKELGYQPHKFSEGLAIALSS